jgi:hypothetical protein
MVSRCIAYDVVDGRVGRCENIVANVSMKVCSNPKCQRMGSSMIEGNRAVIKALLNIMGDDVDNTNWSVSEADELSAVMEALPMLHEIDSVVNVEHFGVISGATKCC